MTRARPAAGFGLVLVLALGACSAGEGTPSPTPTIGPLELADAVCEWQDELLFAVGNPDTGSDSEAWQAFESALAAGDADAVREAAQPILDHLEIGAEWALRMTAYPGAESGGTHLGALMDGLADAVLAMRDAAVAGEADAARAGQDLVAAAYEHFWPGLDALRGPITATGGVDGSPCRTDPVPET